MSTNTNFQALLTDKNFIQLSKINEIAKVSFNVGKATKQRFNVMLQLGKHCANALEYFKSDDYKAKAKEFNVSLTIEQLIKETYNYKKSFFYDLAKIGKIEQSKVDEYMSKVDGDNFTELSVKGLLKFANGNETEGEGEGEGEGEVKEKSENLKISVDKNSKISIKGKASKQVLTLLIEELKKLLTEEKTPKNKAESLAA